MVLEKKTKKKKKNLVKSRNINCKHWATTLHRYTSLRRKKRINLQMTVQPRLSVLLIACVVLCAASTFIYVSTLLALLHLLTLAHILHSCLVSTSPRFAHQEFCILALLITSIEVIFSHIVTPLRHIHPLNVTVVFSACNQTDIEERVTLAYHEHHTFNQKHWSEGFSMLDL